MPSLRRVVVASLVLAALLPAPGALSAEEPVDEKLIRPPLPIAHPGPDELRDTGAPNTRHDS
jgi:hypothetical protein